MFGKNAIAYRIVENSVVIGIFVAHVSFSIFIGVFLSRVGCIHAVILELLFLNLNTLVGACDATLHYLFAVRIRTTQIVIRPAVQVAIGTTFSSVSGRSHLTKTLVSMVSVVNAIGVLVTLGSVRTHVLAPMTTDRLVARISRMTSTTLEGTLQVDAFGIGHATTVSAVRALVYVVASFPLPFCVF